MRLSNLVGLALLAGVLVVPAVATATAPAVAVECPASTPYPGDDAAKPDIAAWMASGAAARGIPGELPVMAALVESGLRNLTSGDADAKGYFQMRESIWNASYPDFPDHPELQLDWFLDQAAAVRTPPYPPESAWGEWAADVEKPAQQYRGRYQLRLQEARTLIGPGCVATDTVPPVTSVSAPARQRAIKKHGIAVPVSCPTEACSAAVRAVVKVGGHPEVTAPAMSLVAGQETTFRLKLRGAVRRVVVLRLAKHRPVRVVVTVTTTDQSGNAGAVMQRVRITG